jgi:hypothetical protein
MQKGGTGDPPVSWELTLRVLHSTQFVAGREELFFMLRAATISWWDRRFAAGIVAARLLSGAGNHSAA